MSEIVGNEQADKDGRTDDDLPPPHQNRISRGGRVSGNGRTAIGVQGYPGITNDMETQIHQLEQEAYSSVLRAFKAQSDAITWEKESLITELRKELRVSDEEHRELLGRVNADDIIRRIREWRKGGGVQPGFPSISQPVHEPIPSPTVSGSRKRQKTLQSLPSLSLSAPSPSLNQQTFSTSIQPSAVKRRAVPGAKTKKPKSVLIGVFSMWSFQYASTGLAGRGQIIIRDPSRALVSTEPTEAATFDPLIGRKVMTRWPEDNNFYEAVITSYDAEKISPEDIRWEDGVPDMFHQIGHGGPVHGPKNSMGIGGAALGAGKGRGGPKHTSKKDMLMLQNGVWNKSDEIEILHTETLIKEVERVFSSSHPDPLEMEKARKVLKEHEQSLVDVISRLADASDGESDPEHQLFGDFVTNLQLIVPIGLVWDLDSHFLRPPKFIMNAEVMDGLQVVLGGWAYLFGMKNGICMMLGHLAEQSRMRNQRIKHKGRVANSMAKKIRAMALQPEYRGPCWRQHGL
ncbi:hypothetical protein ACLOJK_021213 [Asimina triloba]